MTYDAIIVGSGPNGLAAAVTLARQGLKVLILEARDTVGGGTRSAELTLPGFVHDVCSAVHPLGMASPFFRSVPLQELGLEWIQPDLPVAHPLGDHAVALCRDLDQTAEELGADGKAYRRLMKPLVANWERVLHEFLGPLRLPQHPLVMARFGMRALFPAAALARLIFRTPEARALFSGAAAHAVIPLEKPATAAFGLMLMMLGHAVGWPIPRGGSQQIADRLAGYLRSLGGEIETGHEVRSLAELPPARAVLMDVSPRQLVNIAGDQLPAGYRRRLERYRYGPGIFKVDYALREPIPWTAEACRRAGTVHVGGALEEISLSEQLIWKGRVSDKPYVIVVQQSLFDDTRAPAGKHTMWAYCHVPHGSGIDMSAAIEAQIERFAPGFRDTIIGGCTHCAQDYERYNPNYVGGDINSGVQDLGQLFTRPVPRLNPYTTPLKRLFICSSSTPPGGGVHGMCGYFAAQAALKRM